MRTNTRQPGAPSVGAIREFGEALASGPFRVAIALSALLHLGLLLGLRGSEAEPPRRPPLRVHFVREVPAPPASPPAARRSAQSDAPAGGGESTRRGSEAPAPQPVPPVPAAPAEVEMPAPQVEPPTVPRPAVKTEAMTEIPREPRVADAAPVAEAPPAAAAPSGEATAVGAPPTTVPSDATVLAGVVSPGGEATGGATATATAADTADTAGAGDAGGEGIPASSSPRAAAGEPNAAPGPSAQEIAALRERIASVARKGYPQIAIRNGWEGRVLVEMQLDLEGRLAAVRLVTRSDHSILDEAAITAVRLASPFQPIARVVTVPVEYRLTP